MWGILYLIIMETEPMPFKILSFVILPVCLYQKCYFLWSLSIVVVAKSILEVRIYYKYLEVVSRYFCLFYFIFFINTYIYFLISLKE